MRYLSEFMFGVPGDRGVDYILGPRFITHRFEIGENEIRLSIELWEDMDFPLPQVWGHIAERESEVTMFPKPSHLEGRNQNIVAFFEGDFRNTRLKPGRIFFETGKEVEKE